MKVLFFLFAFATFTFSCANSKKALEGDSSDAYGAFQPVDKGDSLFASIERTFCFGTCPVYVFKINNDGTASYEGVRNVKRMGTYSAKVTPAQMNKLIEVAKSIGYMDFKDKYDNESITDLPSTTTSIVIDGKRKEVMRRYQFPKEIKVLEDAFDVLIETLDWKLEKAPEM